ncbi:unnamed protein product [Prorocentrum cordatum]|uniref:Uncharacterized protein n=1 Tax=Prorocentrum cordatum TaxID=2364126 RepID=A0ABN9SP36_9DINO|nr:unnamed protein product [Polarella glacialis]
MDRLCASTPGRSALRRDPFPPQTPPPPPDPLPLPPPPPPPPSRASALPPWRRRRLPRPRKSRGRGRPAPPRPSTGGRRAAEGGPRRGHSGRRRRRTAAASKSYPRHAPVQNWVFLWILRRRTMCGRVLTLASEGSAGVEFWQHAAPEVR